MKVALITLEGGGISTVCYGLARSLSKKNIPTTVFTETSCKSSIENPSTFLTVNRLRRLDIPPRFFWFQANNLRFLLQVLKQYSLVHAVSPDAAVILTLFRRKLQIPFIASFHSVPFQMAKIFLNSPISSWTPAEFAYHILEYPMHDLNLRRSESSVDRVILCSFTALEQLRLTHKKINQEKVSIIYNAVDFDEIDSVRVDDPNEQSGPSLVFSGRLFWLKGPIYLLRALEILKSEFKDLTLKIFGKGPEENRIRKFVSDTGLQDQVRFCGRVPHRTMIAEIKKSDAVVAPSLHEVQSMVMLEAMACKKPVIAFDILPNREIIEDGNNGLLAKVSDVKALSEKIRLALSDPKLRLKIGQNAYTYAKREHNWETQIEKYINEYNKVLE